MRVVGISLLAVILLRLPFLDAPLTADEGGYAEVARLWSRGGRLYQSVWVDRPQGLELTFRSALRLRLATTVELRLVAVVAAVALSLLVFLAVRWLCGDDRLAAVATAGVSTAAASPFIDGFTLSGELLGSVCAAGAVAAYARFTRTERRSDLVLTGLAGGAAVTMKQSAFDGVIAVVGALVISRRRHWLVDACVVAFAAAIPVASCAIGADDARAWFGAVVGYGVEASPSAVARLTSFAGSLPAALLALGPLMLASTLGWKSAAPVVRMWLAAAALGLCVGGSFHHHYYLQLAAPLAVLGAHGVLRGGRRHVQRTVAALALVPVLVAAPLWLTSDATQARVLWPADAHLRSDAAVARWLESHTRRSASVAVVWAAADIFYLADRRPATRYLWRNNLEAVPRAVPKFDQLLAHRVPAVVVEAQPPQSLPGSGPTAAIVRRNYRRVAAVGSELILERRPR